MYKTEHQESALISNTPITPSTVANMFQLQHPKFPVIVRGEVTGLRPYPQTSPHTYYGDISDDGFTLEFKVQPSDKLKSCGQFIEIVGTIKEEPNKITKSIIPMLTGEVVGEYQPVQQADFVVHDNLQMDAKVSLRSFLKQNTKLALAFLATRNGYNDFIQACNDKHKIDDLVRLDCNLMGKENIINSLRQVIKNPAIKGIVILRGGRTSNNDLRIWNDIDVLHELYKLKIPFYTAIGHASDLLLVDKHAHESYTTPTMFGNKYREALNEIYWDNKQDNRIKDLERELLIQGPIIKQQRKYIIIGGIILTLLLLMEIKYNFIHKVIQLILRP